MASQHSDRVLCDVEIYDHFYQKHHRTSILVGGLVSVGEIKKIIASKYNFCEIPLDCKSQDNGLFVFEYMSEYLAPLFAGLIAIHDYSDYQLIEFVLVCPGEANSETRNYEVAKIVKQTNEGYIVKLNHMMHFGKLAIKPTCYLFLMKASDVVFPIPLASNFEVFCTYLKEFDTIGLARPAFFRWEKCSFKYCTKCFDKRADTTTPCNKNPYICHNCARECTSCPGCQSNIFIYSNVLTI